MPLADLLAPICAATIVNVFLFALLWRGDRLEARTGRAHWYYLGVFLYSAGVVALLYTVKDKPITGGPALFAVASAAEAIGVVIAWTIHGAFIGCRYRDPARRPRLLPDPGFRHADPGPYAVVLGRRR